MRAVNLVCRDARQRLVGALAHRDAGKGLRIHASVKVKGRLKVVFGASGQQRVARLPGGRRVGEEVETSLKCVRGKAVNS